ncbi:phosphate acetyltransferase [Gryllotalpicola ginsengisoli]|uniref:phosphate acetyltransferase n=1 Tax=Gryllotalpicola ginsengisoli TaxID=444608 RepID=UPI0003B3D245|nr:phosphate acetyltransferase [Gryllotalpicola ginsengisoli]
MKQVYITSAEGHTGKSTVALGVLRALTRQVARVGVFRPIARSTAERDYVLEWLLANQTAELGYDEAVGVSYDEVHADPESALSRIVARYKAVEARCDAVVIVGSDYTDVGAPTELSYNARIAANLGAPVLLVVGGRAAEGDLLGTSSARTPAQVRQLAEVAMGELKQEHAALLGLVVNRADPEQLTQIRAAVQASVGSSPDAAGLPARPVWVLPEDPLLVAPTVQAVLASVGGRLISGDPQLLEREVLGVVVAGMSMENVLTRLIEGAVVVVPGDRSEVLLAVLSAYQAGTFPSVSAIVMNGGFALSEAMRRLLAGIGSPLPIIEAPWGTYDTTVRVNQSRTRLGADSPRKQQRAIDLFDRSVNHIELLDALEVEASPVVTPLMFEYRLIERARAQRRHIVLPEGGDDRILHAASRVIERDIAQLTILGDEHAVRGRASALGLDLDAAAVIDPVSSELRQRFGEEYTRLRASKGMTLERALDTVTDVSYFGTMMVQLGLADGMVSGAAHTTAHTIRPAFEIIKTKPGVSVVSSVFLMALADRVLVYGDCAVIPDPTAEQLADIAVSSAATAEQFGIEPRVAMLSYSTGESGSGADVEKVRAATELVRERAPELLVEGPLQYDAAADAVVAAAKMPGSKVAGRATVFIFPDLNTGNNTYKAVQRSAGAVAIGPVLQGLRKPVNDLSRGALVDDIVNTIAITAIQAQAVGADG